MNPKILKNPYFYSAKMAPQKVDNPVTFKGANPLTLWRPKRGQPNNSPAHIYIYIYIEMWTLWGDIFCISVKKYQFL